MNLKTAHKYELIADIVDGEGDTIKDLLELVTIDFTTAFELWEYALGGKHNPDLVPLGLDLFLRASETKTKVLFCDSAPLQKLLFSSQKVMSPNVVLFLVNFILTNRLDVAGECLMRLRANTNIDFNDAMRVIVDRTFLLNCEKNGTRIPIFNKKQKELLTEHIEKIKGPNRALLLQRMKEI
jgi:hypothetical protein